MHKRVSAHGGPFTTLVRTYPCGTIPDNSPPLQPPPLRNTVTSQVIWTDKGAALNNALMTLNPLPTPFSPLIGVLRVVDNDFTTGRAAVQLGDFALVSNIDFPVGVAAADTAANIATAISRIPGFFSFSIFTDVGINYDAGTADVVEFRVVHYGATTNFLAVVPTNGELGFGAPFVGPPLIG